MKEESTDKLIETYNDIGKYLRKYGKYNDANTIINLKIRMAQIDSELKRRHISSQIKENK